MKVVWSPLALRRVDEILDHMSADRPAAAVKWAEELFDLVARLRKFPDRGRAVPELGQLAMRELIYGDDRVVYKIERARIDVLTVRHARRRFEVSEPRPRIALRHSSRRA